MSKRFILVLFLLGMVLHDIISQIDIQTDPMIASVCPGDSAMFEVTVSPETDSVRWQYANSSTGPWLPLSFDINGVETTMLTVFNSQFYNGKHFRIIALDEGVAVDSSTSASLIQRIPPVPVIDPSNSIFCMGGSDTLFAIVSPGNYTYLWSTNSTADSIIVTSSGSYFVTVTDEYGCFGIDSTDVLVKPNPEPIVYPPVPYKICTMGDDTIKLRTTIEYDLYSWSTTETTPSIVVSQPGIVSVTVTDDGCSASASIMVIYHPVPDPIIDPSMPQFCQGMDIVISADPGYILYKWQSGQSTREISVIIPGIYTVTVTNGNNCEGVESVSVIENINPQSVIESNQNPISLVEDQFIEFRDSSMGGSGAIVLWEWDYGENAIPAEMSFDTAHNKKFVKYEKFGFKTVTLCVTDDKGCTNCNSLPQFYVNGNGPKVDLTKEQGVCVTDITKLKVTIEPSNAANPDLVISENIEWSLPPGEIGWDSLGALVWVNDKKLEQCRFVVFNDPNENHLVSVKGFQIETLTQEITENVDSELVYTGLPYPEIDENSTNIPDFLCEGGLDSIEIRISPPSESYIVYRKNGGQSILDTALNGVLIVPITAELGSAIFAFEVLSIELNQGCRNSNVSYKVDIPVRRRPILEFVNPDVVCVGSIDTIYAFGAEAYIWKSNGLETTTDSFRIIPTTIEQQILYNVTGTTDGCTSEANVLAQVVEPPDPSILDNPAVCSGQVITYESNSNQVMNVWNAENGDILGSDTGDSVLVLWENSGKLTLIQQAGECIDSTEIDVLVSDEESPPYDTLEYLEGGGILLYPNPSFIQGLCYKWYRDGQLLTDTYQGCVVGTNLSEAELSKFSVEVYFCNQGEDCSQVITYRAIEEEPITTDFKLKVVPNPNDGIFVLEYEITEVGTYIQYIFDSSGRLVHKETIALETKTGNLNLSLLNADSGIYFIQLINSTSGEYRVVPFSILQ